VATSSGSRPILIVGGGTAGITVAARLRPAGATDITVLDPAVTHYHQPLWTLVGGGQADIRITGRPESSVIPHGVNWIAEAAAEFRPDVHAVVTDTGRELSYDALVIAPGLRLEFDRVPGLADALAVGPVSSNYRADLAPRTWELIRNMRSGTAVFTHPTGPVKCAGAPQKIAYLAADHWRRRKVLDAVRIVLVLPDPAMFKVPVWAAQLEKVARRYGIEVRLNSEMASLDGGAAGGRTAEIVDNANGTKETLSFDLLHAVPPQRAPEVIEASPLANPVQPVRLRRRRPVHAAAQAVRRRVRSRRRRRPADVQDRRGDPQAGPRRGGQPARRPRRPRAAHRYDGYTSCTLVTARDKMLLAEFDYDLKPAPTIPLIDTTKERRDMWLLKRYGLPALYWHGMLKGLV
jgi:sulfide:quinone oxidoreductase